MQCICLYLYKKYACVIDGSQTDIQSKITGSSNERKAPHIIANGLKFKLEFIKPVIEVYYLKALTYFNRGEWTKIWDYQMLS